MDPMRNLSCLDFMDLYPTNTPRNYSTPQDLRTGNSGSGTTNPEFVIQNSGFVVPDPEFIQPHSENPIDFYAYKTPEADRRIG